MWGDDIKFNKYIKFERLVGYICVTRRYSCDGVKRERRGAGVYAI